MAEASRTPDRVWSSRKFVSAWILTAVFTVLVWCAKIDGGSYMIGTGMIWGFYMSANVGDKLVDRRK